MSPLFSVIQKQRGILSNIATGECMRDSGDVAIIYRTNCGSATTNNLQLTFYDNGNVQNPGGRCMGVKYDHPTPVDTWSCINNLEEYWSVETYQCGFYLDIRINSYHVPEWCVGIDDTNSETETEPCANYTVNPSQWWRFHPVCSTSDESIGKQ